MKDKQVNFRVDDATYRALTAAAKEAGMSLGSWMTQLAMTATGRSTLHDQLERIKKRKPARRP